MGVGILAGEHGHAILACRHVVVSQLRIHTSIAVGSRLVIALSCWCSTCRRWSTAVSATASWAVSRSTLIGVSSGVFNAWHAVGAGDLRLVVGNVVGQTVGGSRNQAKRVNHALALHIAHAVQLIHVGGLGQVLLLLLALFNVSMRMR